MDQTIPPPSTPPTDSNTLSVANGGTGPTLTGNVEAPTTVKLNITAARHLKLFLKGLLTDVTTVAKDIWNDNKTIFLVLLPIIAVIYGRNFLMSLIVSNAKKTFTNATQQDDKLAQQENTANTEANQLIQTANSLPAKELPLDDEHWYLGKK